MMRNAVGCSLIVVVISTFSVSQILSDSALNSDSQDSRGWGPWTGWSVCSQTCGYGTSYRIRHCHAHHHYRHGSGSTCQGDSKQYKICILKNCSHVASDYRSAECAKHNNVYYGKQMYSWIPYINSAAPCELSCKSVGYGYYARFQKTVPDLIICNDENTAVCIQGQCVKSGCDAIIGSGSSVDKCGVCGGDDTSCRLIRGIFTQLYLTHRGYNIITTIPAGARSINITEMGRSHNNLALSTQSGYFLNGDMRLQHEGDFIGAGTTFNYRRGRGLGCPGECLTAPGPLSTNLRVELIYFGRNAGIYYEFTILREETRSIIESMASPRERGTSLSSSQSSHTVSERKATYQNEAGLIVLHHTTPGAGLFPRIKYGKSPEYIHETENPRQQVYITSRVTFPRSSSFPTSRHIFVDNVEDVHKPLNLQQHSPPSEALSEKTNPNVETHKQKSHKDTSQNKWQREPGKGSESKALYEPPKDQFHVTGANGSVEYRHYYHTNIHDDIGDIPMVAPLKDDSNEQDRINTDTRPSWLPSDSVYDTRYQELKSEIKQAIPPKYSSLPRDTQSSFQKQQSGDGTYSKDSSHYTQGKYNGYDNRLSSNVLENQLYTWRISGFTPCTESCGGGLQETRVVCVKGDSQVEVVDDNCNPRIKPGPTIIVCNNQPCGAKWEMGEWTTCSVTCGRGLQKRTVECKQRISPSLTISVTSPTCPQPQPLTKQYCQLDPCFTWQVSNWTKCSTVCGFGERTRIISCVDPAGLTVDDSLCTYNKPATTELCDMGSCAQGWFHTKWSSECSSQCGKGYYTRQVFCSAADDTKLEESKCGGKRSKPREHKTCKVTKPCGGQWFTGSWSQCSATCGSNVYRQRDVLCIKRHGKTINQVVKENNCVKEERPAHRELCGSLPACKPQWFFMPWSECSEACGTGVKTREVKCLDDSFKSSPDCDKELKPSHRQHCNTQPCKEKYPAPTEPLDTTTNEALQRDGSVSTHDHQICKDSQTAHWCQLAKQARLCNYPDYRKICCHTCRRLDPNHH